MKVPTEPLIPRCMRDELDPLSSHYREGGYAEEETRNYVHHTLMSGNEFPPVLSQLGDRIMRAASSVHDLAANWNFLLLSMKQEQCIIKQQVD